MGERGERGEGSGMWGVQGGTGGIQGAGSRVAGHVMSVSGLCIGGSINTSITLQHTHYKHTHRQHTHIHIHHQSKGAMALLPVSTHTTQLETPTPTHARRVVVPMKRGPDAAIKICPVWYMAKAALLWANPGDQPVSCRATGMDRTMLPASPRAMPSQMPLRRPCFCCSIQVWTGKKTTPMIGPQPLRPCDAMCGQVCECGVCECGVCDTVCVTRCV